MRKICVYDRNGEVKFVMLEGPGAWISGIKEVCHKKHFARFKRKVEVFGCTKKIVKIPCITPTDLLAKHNISHVDFCTIDTEGSEFEILKAMEFEKYTIDVIAIEDNYGDKPLRSFMEKSGYRRETKLGLDEIFVRRGRDYEKNSSHNKSLQG